MARRCDVTCGSAFLHQVGVLSDVRNMEGKGNKVPKRVDVDVLVGSNR